MTQRLLYILLIPVWVLLLTTCGTSNLEIALNYAQMLQQEYGKTGEGRIIPVTIENAIEVDGTVTKDGNYLYYTSNRDRGNYDIYLRSMNDITTVRVTGHASKDYEPSISPDGKYLAYISQKDDPEGDLFVVRVRSSSMLKDERDINETVEPRDDDAKNISSFVEESGLKRVIKDSNPSWSPDSKLIAFSSERDGTENIYICERDGDNLRQLTFQGGMHPSFSPDGQYIAFISYRDPESKGDIYTVHVETGTVKQITDSPDIEMYPSFTKTNYELVYTLFDKDTNKDGLVDLADKSVIQYRNINTQQTYPLTFYSLSSFSPRYFPVYSFNFEETDQVNYSGIIVFSQQIGNNIDINIMPEYGVIPKRQTAAEQYETALKYINEDNDYEKYITAMLRVYYFFGGYTDSESEIFTSRALKEVALDAYQNGNEEESQKMLELLTEEGDQESVQLYKSITVEYLSEVLNGRDGGRILKQGLEDLAENSPFTPYLLEGLGDYYISVKDEEQALEYYDQVLEEHPQYIRRQYVNYTKGIQTFDSEDDEISKELIEVLQSGTPYQKDETVKFLLRSYRSDLDPAKRDEKMKALKALYEDEEGREYRLICASAVYISALTSFNRNESLTEDSLKEQLEKIDQETVLYYSINKLLADSYKREEEKEKEETHLFNALNSYKARWNQQDLEEIVVRLVDFYEERGRKYELDNNFREAAEVYRNYTVFMSSLKDKRIKKFDSIYDQYATRAHVLRIDADYRNSNYSYSSLERLRDSYHKYNDRARRNFDKSHLFGLAYIYTKLGYHLDQYYLEDPTLAEVRTFNPPQAELINTELIAKQFRRALDTLEWSLYMDDSFSDSYLLKGWIYHYIDARRERELRRKTELGYLYESYFPDYLLENGIDTYERSLETNNELKFPEKEGNIHLNMANTYFVLVNYPEALKHYQAASKYKTTYASREQQALFNFHLGYCYYQLGDLEKANEQIKKVETLYTDIAGGEVNARYAWQFIQIYRYYSLFARINERYDETIQWYNRILDVGARFNVGIDRARYLQEIAYCYIQMKKYNSALEYLNRADTLLETYNEDDTPKHNLRITWIGFVKIDYDLGADQTVFGDSRLFQQFDTFTKKVYSLTLREMLYKTKGDYPAVVQTLNSKLDLIKGKKLKIHKEIRLRTFNNLGHAYFIIGDYENSEKFFKEAWDYADDIENQQGIFYAIGNMTSLYSFLFENRPEYFNQPVRKIDDFVKDIEEYSANYEKIELKLRTEKLEENNKVRGLPEPTIEDKRKIEEQVKADAEQKYFKLNIYKATLNFYKAENLFKEYSTQLAEVSRRNEENVYNYNTYVYSLYSDSASIFEDAVANKKTNDRTRLKLMLNASICRERLGQIDKAFEQLENAQKIAETYRYEDSLILIYYKEALFLDRYTEEVGYDRSRVEEFYNKSLKIIEESPQLYVNRAPVIRSIYNDFSAYRIRQKKYEEAFALREKKRRFNLIAQMYIVSPVFAKQADRDQFETYKYAINDLELQKKNVTLQLEKNEKKTDKDVLIKGVEEKSTSIANLAAEDSMLSLFTSYGSSKVQLDSTSRVFDVGMDNTSVFGWKITNNETAFFNEEISSVVTDQTSAKIQALSTLLKKMKGESEQDTYCILSEELYALMVASGRNTEIEQVNGFSYIFALFDMPYVTTLSRSLLSEGYKVSENILSESEEADLVQHSLIIDNRSTSDSLARTLFASRVRPSLVIRNSQDSLENKRLIYYSALYNGTSNLLFTHTNELNSLREKDTFLESFSDFEEMNTVPGNNVVFALGRTGAIQPEETDLTVIAQDLYDSYQKNMIEGNAEEARYYLFRWKDVSLETPNIDYIYSLYLSSIYAYAGNYQSAVEVLTNLNLDQLSDQDLKSKIESHRLYYLLCAGNVREVSSIMSAYQENASPYTGTTDYTFFSTFVSAISSGRPFVNIPEDHSIEQFKLGILAAKYNSLFGYEYYASENTALTFESEELLSDKDLLFVHTYHSSEKDYGSRINTMMSIRNAENVDQIRERYESSVYNNGLIDQLSPYAFFYVMKRLPEIYQTALFGYVISEGSIAELHANTGGLDKLIILHQHSMYYKAEARYEQYLALIDQQISLAESYALDPLVASLKFEKAVHFAERAEFSSMRPLIRDLEAIPRTHRLYVKAQLLRAEDEISRNRLDNGVEILNSVLEASGEDVFIKQLLELSINIQLLQSGRAVMDESAVRRSFENLLSEMDEDPSVIGGFSRPELFIRVCDNMIVHDSFTQFHSHALKTADVKKQFRFMHQYSDAVKQISKDSVYASLDYTADIDAIKTALQKKREAYFASFLPNLSDTVSGELSESEAVVYFEKVQNHIYVWFVTESSIEGIILENGYTVFSELNNTYQRLLLNVQSMSAVSTRINEFFANVTSRLTDYDDVIVVMDSLLNDITLEYLGDTEPFIESKSIRYLPTLSSLLLEKDDSAIDSVVIIIPDKVSLNDRLEHLALRESGIEFTIADFKDVPEPGSNLHIQQNIYYDALSRRTILRNEPFEKKIQQCNLIFVSGNGVKVENANIFVLLNMLKGSNSVVLNNTAIRDVNSAIIVREFYSSLLLNSSVVDSFTAAKKKLYFNSLYSHPSYWSYTRLYSH